MTVVEVRGNTEVHQRGVRDGPPVMVQVIKDTVEIILWGLAQGLGILNSSGMRWHQ